MGTIGPITGSPIVAITERCLNTRHRSAGCRRCVDVCPVDAVTLVDDRPLVDPSACLGCGACMPQCPTQALVAPESMRTLRQAVADSPAGAPIRLACPRGGTSPSWMPTIRHDRCLAALGAEELLDLAGDERRDLWLDDTPCATCDLARLHPAIHRAAAEANQACAAIGLGPVARRASVEDAVAGAAHEGSGRVIDAHDGRVSRRGLFRRLVDVDTGPGAKTGTCIPERRQRVLLRLRRWAAHAPPQRSTTQLPGFGTVRVDRERCSACGMCALFCPTNALTAPATAPVRGPSTFELRFDPSTCVGCGLCATACPESAVTVDTGVDPNTVVTGASTIVVTVSTIACSVCGSATAARPGTDSRCFSCRGGVVTSLRDEVGLMADLLGRLPPP